MRIAIAVIFCSLVATPSASLAQGAASIQGFGGLSMNALQPSSPSLGGAVSFDITPGIQILGEAGRLANVMPPLASAVFSLARTDVRASAFYGEAGVRFLVAPRRAMTPYVDAAAGLARLNVGSPRLGAIGNVATSLVLGAVGRTAPMLGAGGGVLVRSGPVVFDVGYRYKQLFPEDALGAVLGLGQPLRAHQLRAGIGVRF